MRSYKPKSSSTRRATSAPTWPILRQGQLRMGMNAHANGGLLLQPLKVPSFRDFAMKIDGRGAHDVDPRACSAACCTP